MSVTFTCPVCGAVSHHPEDVAQRYCGRCHVFTGDLSVEAAAELLGVVADNGYYDALPYDGGSIVAVDAGRLFGAGSIIRFGDPFGIIERWDFETLELAREAMRRWGGDRESEPDGWVRHLPSMRRRLHGDPATEEVRP